MTRAFPEIPQHSLKGFLHLDFKSCPERGITQLKNAYRTGLFHFSKPYWDDQQLVVQVVNPTAGVFEGDSMQSRFSVGSGARACIMAPSSTQVYSMPSQTMASSDQSFLLADGAALAFIPKWLVLHKGALFKQTTRIDLSGKSSLFHVDLLSAGRASFGEFLEFDQLLSMTEIAIDGRLFLRERLACGRSLNRWIWISKNGPFAYLANLYIHFPGAGPFCEEIFRSLPDDPADDTAFGYSVLTENFVSLRIPGKSSHGVEALVKQVARMLSAKVPASSVYTRIV